MRKNFSKLNLALLLIVALIIVGFIFERSMLKKNLSFSILPTPTLNSDEKRLANLLGFADEALLILKEESGKNIQQLKILGTTGLNMQNNFKNDIPINGIQVDVPHAQSRSLVAKLSSNPKLKGYLPFLSEDKFGLQNLDDSVGIIKSSDQYDILRIKKTIANEPGIPTEDIINKLKQWDDKYSLSIKVIGADFDWFEAKYINQPVNFNDFVKEIYSFCPDNINYAFQDIKDLTSQLQKYKNIYCWWD